MTKTVYFHTNGELPEESFKLMGVSVKEDNAIGKFGTGLKYAIAGIQRFGGDIAIVTEDETYSFGTEEVDFKGKTFERITCNDSPLAYTTDYGKEWEGWQIFRELYSNTLDEGGHTSLERDSSYTTIIEVDCAEVYGAFKDINNIFVSPNMTPLAKTAKVEIYPFFSDGLFYKGVKVGSNFSRAFTFNIISGNIDLTEDRTLKYTYQPKHEIGESLIKIDDESLIARILENEDNVSFPTYSHIPENSSLVSCLRKLYLLNRCSEVNNTEFVKFYKNSGYITHDKEEVTGLYKKKLDKALRYMESIGYTVTAPIYIIESVGDHIFAEAKDGEILLTKKAFEAGTFDLVMTLMEEHFHIVSGHQDCTRSFQEYIFRQLVLMSENVTGETL
jgi:hypothetical protein